jgi:GcrA cell cycle regulator
MEWSDEVITLLRGLWAEGLSTAEIGRRLGVTKNAIVGKAHRLDLPARPSPIRRDPDAVTVRRGTVRRHEGPTLPPLPSTCVEAEQAEADCEPPPPVPVAPPVAARPPSVVRTVMAAPRPVMASPARPPVVAQPRPMAPAPRPYARVVTCCWPLGEPGTKEFRFCDAPSEPGRPYCEDHVKLAYVKIRDKREDAA